MPIFKIKHITNYKYESPVRDSANQIILFPIKDEYQDVVKQELNITGHPIVDTHIDYYGNEVGSFTYSEPHSMLIINSRLTVKNLKKTLFGKFALTKICFLAFFILDIDFFTG